MVKKFISISLTLFYLFSDLNATHIRAGEIIAKRISSTSLTYEFTIIGYTDTDSTLKKIYYENALNLFPRLKENNIFNHLNE